MLCSRLCSIFSLTIIIFLILVFECHAVGGDIDNLASSSSPQVQSLFRLESSLLNDEQATDVITSLNSHLQDLKLSPQPRAKKIVLSENDINGRLASVHAQLTADYNARRKSLKSLQDIQTHHQLHQYRARLDQRLRAHEQAPADIQEQLKMLRYIRDVRVGTVPPETRKAHALLLKNVVDDSPNVAIVSTPKFWKSLKQSIHLHTFARVEGIDISDLHDALLDDFGYNELESLARWIVPTDAQGRFDRLLPLFPV